MSQALCMKCFAEDHRIVYTCAKPGCSMEGTPIPVQDASLDEQSRPVCQECATPLTHRLCPSCGYPMEEGGTGLLLSIAGAQGSGKSNYLSVLIDRIKSDLGKAYGCALHPIGGDATMSAYDREYHHPLFVQGRCPSSTQQEDVEPLKYSLVFSGKPPSGKTCNLAFYDACGANFESEKALAAGNRNIIHSRGIVLLLDPSQLQGTREHLSMQGKPVLDADPAALLARMIHLIRTGSGLGDMQQQIPIPIAVCLSKLDTVQDMLDPSSFVMGASRHLGQPALSRLDWDCCNLEVQSLMESWGGGELVTQIKAQFSKHSFFALSALGGQPGEQGQVYRIAPHRVLDPLLWILWQNNVIRCK